MIEKLRMLIVDDSYPNRMVLSDEFKKDFQIILAEDGKEAISILETTDRLAVIILDLIMPEVDGFEVLRFIEASPLHKNIPVIVITSSDDTTDYIKAMDMGAVDVICKPINTQLISRKIRNLLERSAENKEMYHEILGSENTDFDPVTGIYNKQGFCKCARALMDANPQRQYVIVRWDIDGFKVVNDVYGVIEGDRVLKKVAESLREVATEGMVYGRWEADHFVICMDSEEFHYCHMLDKITNIFDKHEFSFEISTRMGIYKVDDTQIAVSIMCDRAYLALKSIKNNYKRHVNYYDDEMRISLIERQQVLNEMKQALDSGQFVVYLQPQINYANNTLHGAEALVRWNHPLRGLIPPAKFIPVFEENGFITHLDQFVWEEVCRLQRKWLDEGYNIVPISVNVSRTDIASVRLAEHLSRLIEKYNLPPRVLRIEITETAYMDNPHQLISSVEKMRNVGFSVEMDDFGSGYSSLNTLKDVPVDMLKLDMKFIEGGGKESRGGSILSSVVRMSTWLKLSVLAEGVETKNQADFLKSIGCVYMQGYYFARPMPVPEFEKLLRENEHDNVFKTNSQEVIYDAMEFLNASNQATLLFNSFVGGAAIIEYDGVRVDALRVNDMFFECTETTREEFVANMQSLTGQFDEENLQKFIRAIERAIETKEEAACELCAHMMHPEREIWTRARVRLLTGNGSKYLLYLSIENISQRMRLLVNNLRLTDQLTSLINNVPGGIVDYTLDLNPNDSDVIAIKYFNDKYPSMFGYTRDEYENEVITSPLQVVYPDDLPQIKKMIDDIRDGQTGNISCKYRHYCKDGSCKWVSFNGSMTNRAGNILSFTAIIVDIDDQMKAEQQIVRERRENAKLNMLLENMYNSLPEGVCVYLFNLGRYRLISCNDTIWKMFGFASREEFIAFGDKNNGLMVSHPDDIEDVRAVEKGIQLLPAGEVLEMHHRVMCKNNEYRPVVTRISKIIFANEAVYVKYVVSPDKEAAEL